jgi:rRNA maturation protein Nop10
MDGGYTLREISPRSGTDILNPLPELLYEGTH